MISMKTIFYFTLIIVYSWNSIVNAKETTIYIYKVTNTEGVMINMENFKGNVLIFVNVPTMYSDIAVTQNLMTLAKVYSKVEVVFFVFISCDKSKQDTNSNGRTFMAVINEAKIKNSNLKIEIFENNNIKDIFTHLLWDYIKCSSPGAIKSYEMFIVSKNGLVVDKAPATIRYEDIEKKIMNHLAIWKNKKSVYDFEVTEINENSMSLRDYQGDVLIVFKLNSTIDIIGKNAYHSKLGSTKRIMVSKNIKVLVCLFGSIPPAEDSKIDEVKNKLKNTLQIFNVFRADLFTRELWKHMISKTSTEELMPEYTAFIIDGNGQVKERIDEDKSFDVNFINKILMWATSPCVVQLWC